MGHLLCVMVFGVIMHFPELQTVLSKTAMTVAERIPVSITLIR